VWCDIEGYETGCVTWRDNKRASELMYYKEVVVVDEVVSHGRLRWYGRWSVKTRVTGYRFAGNYWLRG